MFTLMLCPSFPFPPTFCSWTLIAVLKRSSVCLFQQGLSELSKLASLDLAHGREPASRSQAFCKLLQVTGAVVGDLIGTTTTSLAPKTTVEPNTPSIIH